MSLLPYFIDETPHWPILLNPNFGLNFTPEEFISPSSPFVSQLRPWLTKDVGSSIKLEKDKWQINVDVQHFAPDEITVKVTDESIIVEGKHEEKKDEHGYVSRQFVRKFSLPDDVNIDSVESRLSSDGVLTIVAPKKAEAIKGERVVPITHTGPVKKEISDTVKTEKNEKK